jgi:hypothetical protein
MPTGYDVDARPRPRLASTTSIEPAASSLSTEPRAFPEQLVRELGERVGVADHVLEGVDPHAGVADVRFAAGDLNGCA